MMEEDGYDPTCSDLLEDPDKAYQPVYIAPERLEDSFSDDLSDEDEEATSDTRENPEQPLYSASVEKRGISSVNRTKYEPSGIVPESGMPEDQEYHVQPLLDLTTPAYAPSQTFGSPSESPLTSSVSGGYPSPVSSIQPSLLTKEDPDRHYRPLLKSEVSGSPRSDVSDLDAADIETEPTHREFQPHSPSPPTSHRSHSPDQLNENLFEGFDEDIDENKLNEDFEGFERDDQPESQVDGIIADIFGESDAEEEFEGFAENEVEKEIEVDQLSHPPEQKTRKHASDSNDGDEGEDDDGDTFVSDFDKIMARKREELSRKRRRNRDIEFLNDSDDMILAMISKMREAADTDRQLLAANKPATKKLKMISEVASLLRRADLKTALIENGMLSAITEWLAPLPGHTLPNLVIRDTMLSCLREFQALPTEVLQDSGIGKALMYLYKHPRETRENKDRAGKLINEWLRPIFNLTSDYRTLTKEERKQLDYEHLPKRRNIENETYDHRDINRELDGEAKGLLRPGDPGWIGRARVPQPSNKDYIVRPKWRVSETGQTLDENDEDAEAGDDSENRSVFRRRRKPASSGGFGATSRIEAHIRNLANSARQKHAKAARAVTMSVEGRKMTL